MTKRSAKLSVDGKAVIELPILEGSLGYDVIDIGQLGGVHWDTT